MTQNDLVMTFNDLKMTPRSKTTASLLLSWKNLQKLLSFLSSNLCNSFVIDEKPVDNRCQQNTPSPGSNLSGGVFCSEGVFCRYIWPHKQNTPPLGACFVFYIDLKYKTRPHKKYAITSLGACFVFEVNMRNKTRPHWRKCNFNSRECIRG